MNTLPVFSKVEPAQLVTAIDTILASNRAAVAALLREPSTVETVSWEHVMQPLEEMDDQLNKVWSMLSHLQAVVDTKPLRDAYNACLPKLSAYTTEMAHNQALYQRVKALFESKKLHELDAPKRKVIKDALRDFHLAGVDLPPPAKRRFGDLQMDLSKKVAQFEQNLLDATHGWSTLVTEAEPLQGLSEVACHNAKHAAEAKGQQGWLFTLEEPSYRAVLLNAEDRSLRESIYAAYITRASDQGPNAGKQDNSQVIEAILTARTEMAHLLGFKHFADYSLATKMVKDEAEVLAFLHQLLEKALPKAKQEFEVLSDFAKERDGMDTLMPWDIGYYSEQLRKQSGLVTQEALRPYFPLEQALAGLFDVVQRLFGLSVDEVEGVDVWHPSVRFFKVVDQQGELRGGFYVDLYARQGKRGGAWMDECQTRRRLSEQSVQIPLAHLVCNFSSPVKDQPTLLTHEEVVTLFHEFGHALHHVMTQIDHVDVSGINGVAWDFVELPSQLLENWAWQESVIEGIAQHYQTQAPLPEGWFEQLQASRCFQTGMRTVRQLTFSLFDFCLHTEFDPTIKGQIQKILDRVRAGVSVTPVMPYDRFQHGFSHIFAGGYAAGYYSYHWAEVLSCDAFAKFEEEGVFNQATGLAFLHHILERGGSEEALVLFERFRHRKPDIRAFLRHNQLD